MAVVTVAAEECSQYVASPQQGKFAWNCRSSVVEMPTTSYIELQERTSHDPQISRHLTVEDHTTRFQIPELEYS